MPCYFLQKTAECLVVWVFRNCSIKSFIKIFNRNYRVNKIYTALFRYYFLRLNIVFVLYLTYYFFDNIFNSNKPFNTAVFINKYSHVNPVLLHVLKQVAYLLCGRCKISRTDNIL